MMFGFEDIALPDIPLCRCCVYPWPADVVPACDGPGMEKLDLDHLATKCAPDPDAVTMMTPAHADAFIPYDDRLIAVADKAVDRLRGLWLPDKRNTGFEWTCYGTVVAVGMGPRLRDGTRRPLDVKVGDRIVWAYRPSREEQTIVHMFGERAILLRESEIAGVVTDEVSL